jgi:hypothetical protein
MPRKRQRLAFRPAELEISEDKNDPLAFHRSVILDRIHLICQDGQKISCNFSRTRVF